MRNFYYYFYFNFGSEKLVEKLAEEIGVEKMLFKTALTKAGINFAHIKMEYCAWQRKGEAKALKCLAELYLDYTYEGLLLLKNKFPNELKIVRGIRAAERYKKYLTSELFIRNHDVANLTAVSR